MNTKKKTIEILMFVLPFVLFISCIQDEHEDIADNDIKSIELSITLPDPVEIVPTTRSLSSRTDYSNLDDLNIVAYHKDGTATVLFIRKDSPGWSVESGSVIIKHDYYSSIRHLSVVANWGEALTSQAGNSPEYLKSMQFSGFRDVMYADAMYMGESGGRSQIEADLVRTIAMVTVSLEVDGTLKDGLNIKPTRVSVKNVPGSVYLGKDNKAGSGNIETDGDVIDNLDWGTLSNDNLSVGETNHSITGENALFLYENKQGLWANNDQTKKAAKDEMQYASYIELEAEYEYAESSGQFTGTIIYRFCLGSNTTDNYNVIRNHHYAVTLKLSDWGGADEGGLVENGKIIEGTSPGVNWRIDMDLDKWGGVIDTVDLDSHMVYNKVLLEGMAGGCTIDDVDWLWIWDGTGWTTPDQITSVSGADLTYLTNPWRLEEPDFPQSDTDQQYRDCKIVINDASTHTGKTIILRQWAPVKIGDNLYMERFESDDATQGILNAKWGGGVFNNLKDHAYIKSVDDADGWVNTRRLSTFTLNNDHQLQACQFAYYKGGGMYERSGLPNPTLPGDLVRVMYYLPNIEELKIMVLKTDNNDVEGNKYDVMTKDSYWSCVPSQTQDFESKYYDNSIGQANYRGIRSDIKKIRAVYRPGTLQ